MTQISKEYAQALFDLSRENGSEKPMLDALLSVRDAFENNPEYIDFLAAPDIPFPVREKALLDAFDQKIPDNAVAFLVILCRRGRIRQFRDCIEAFESLYDELSGISTAEVVSAVPLTDSEKNLLLQKLEKKSGHKVRLMCRTDASLLGGMIVTMDGKVTDGSLKHRLNEVKEVMKP